jgi:pectin methylesterase-like acyl-CoA thioesterase
MTKGVKTVYTYIVERTKTTSRIKRLAVVLIAFVLVSAQMFALLGGNSPADRNVQSQGIVNSSVRASNGSADTTSLESDRLLATAAGSTLVNDTFADSNSQNQDLANHSLRVFNGRAGTIRTDAPGSVTFDMTNAGGSEGFWSFFTDGQPVTLGVGDKLSVAGTFSLQGFANNGQDIRFGLFDSKGTRTTANTTGGMNSPAFTDDSGYALAFFASGAGNPFVTYRRSTIPGSTGILNAFTDFTPISGTGAAARQTLTNDTPYTLSYTVERVSATETKISVSVTGGTLSGLSYTATESSSTPATTFDWFGFRVNGTSFATKMAFTRLAVEYTPPAPIITTQPQLANLTVQVGSNVTMSVGAGGTQLAYQWHKDGAPISGQANPSATTSTLTLTNVQVGDTGSYTAVVSNAGGSVTSSPVNLTVSEEPVAPPPTITTQPESATVTVGSPAQFSVAATGEGLFYQWYKNGALINGATNATLAFTSAQPADSGTYMVVVSNSGGSVTSNPATLLVVSPMAVTSVAPANGASNLNIDVPLAISFDQAPRVGTSGKIRIFTADGTLVDTIDLGVDTNTGIHAPGPQSARQIGGSSWAFNYHPIMVSGNTAAIYPSKALAYGQTYYVTIEPGVLTDASGAPFGGSSDPHGWRFSTKASGPAAGTTTLTVAAAGSGDFNTVQGAIDFVPANNPQPVTITVRRGSYTEIVYVRSSKPFITVRGEDRNASVIQYPNNENLNSGSSPRAMFGVDAPDFTLENITLHNTTTKFNSENRTRQSEAFRGNNNRILLNQVTLKSFQDTLLLQSRPGVTQGGFVNESYIEGDVDFLWGTGTVFFRNSELKMITSNAYYTQIRNDSTKNGYVFLNSRLTAAPGVTGAYLSRIDPDVFPYSQVVFIDSVMGPHIRPEAWRFDNPDLPGGATPTNYPNIKFWEYNSRDTGGAPIDVSQRHPLSRQMTAEEAAFWRNPANVLGGWVPLNVDTAPPSLTLPNDLTLEATGPDGAVATYTASANDQIDGTVPINFSIPSGSTFPLGTTTVTVSAQDTAGNIAWDSFTITVRDTSAPIFQSLTASPDTIADPNGKMVPVTLKAEVSDLVDPMLDTRIISVTSNEPVNELFGGDTAPDWEITGPLALNVRAERDNKGTGRIYTITVESRDEAGNVSLKTATVTVQRWGDD